MVANKMTLSALLLACTLKLISPSPIARAQNIQEIERWNRAKNNSGATVLQSNPPSKRTPRREAPKSSAPTKDSSVDLSVDLESPSQGRPTASSKLAEPNFKIYFDFLLQRRPGINPLTFDHYHTLLLLEILPNADLSFSFEVNPSPRYYELNLKLTPNLMLRLGRIWIPFDQMNPHNMFGGWIYTSRFSQPNARSVFLPDLWTDLGVGFRYQLADSKAINLATDLYFVNGFQDGGSDPLGQVSVYPSFSSPSGVDNNAAKGVGTRLSALLGGRLSLGASVYRDVYSDESLASTQSILMLGLDGGFRLSTTEIRAGYISMKVSLPSPASTGLTRGAIYTELIQRFGKNWRAFLRAGSAQNDNRVIDVTDKQVLGASLQYDKTLYKIELQYYRDLNKIPVKVNTEFMAARFVVSL